MENKIFTTLQRVIGAVEFLWGGGGGGGGMHRTINLRPILQMIYELKIQIL